MVSYNISTSHYVYIHVLVLESVAEEVYRPIDLMSSNRLDKLID